MKKGKWISLLLAALMALNLITVPAGVLAADDPTPLFEETFEDLEALSQDQSWFDNSYYKKTEDGIGDNYPTTTPAEISKAVRWDPAGGYNHVVDTSYYNQDKKLIGRDLPYENKIVEVWAYDAAPDYTGGDNNVQVGEVRLIMSDSTKFKYRIAGVNNTQAQVVNAKYPDSEDDLVRTLGWHQYVFDYTAGDGYVSAYIDGVKIIDHVQIPADVKDGKNDRTGKHLAIGDGKDNEAQGKVRSYRYDNIRVWDTGAIDHVLSLAPAPPTADDFAPEHTEGVPMLTEQFEEPLVGWKGMTYNSTLSKNVPTEEDVAINTKYRLTEKASSEFNTTKSLEAFGSKSLYYWEYPTWARNKVTEVWFYDDYTNNNRSTGKRVRIAAKVGSAFIGINDAADSIVDGDKYYCADATNCTTKTTVKRSDGWHQFLFDYTTTHRDYIVRLYIDGELVNKVTLKPTDDISGLSVQLGSEHDSSSFGSSLTDPDSGLYFDNFNVWETLEEALPEEEEPDAEYTPGQPLYEETFDNNFDFSDWYNLEWDGSKNAPVTILDSVKQNSLSSEQAHTGDYSLKITADKQLFNRKLPGIKQDKVIEVWFYDDPETHSKLATPPMNTRIGATVGACYIGVNELTLKNDDKVEERAKYYSTRIQGIDNTYMISNIERSKGWHQFVFDYTIGGGHVTLLIDGEAVRSEQIPADQDRGCKNVVLGDENQDDGNTSNLYFDTLRAWELMSELPNARYVEGAYFSDNVPVNNVLDADINESIQIKFTEEMKEETLAGIQLMAGETPVEASRSYANKVYTITPSVPLTTNTVYKLMIPTTVETAGGTALPSERNYQFKTYDAAYKVTNKYFTDENGFAVPMLQGGTVIQGNAVVRNRTGNDKTVTPILGFYQNGEMVDFVVGEAVTITGNQKAQTISVQNTLPQDVSNMDVQFFVWDSISGMEAQMPKLSFAESGMNIVYIGGSITEGTSGGVTFEDRWPTKVSNYFEKATGRVVNHVNSGIGGTGSDLGIRRLYSDVIAYDPDVVYVEFAVNDRNMEEAFVKDNMESIVRDLLALPKKPIINFVYTTTQAYDACVDWHEAVAQHYGIPSIDLQAYMKQYFIDKPEVKWADLYGDGVHPNANGYAVYADYIIKVTSENPSQYMKPATYPVPDAAFQQD